MHCSRKLRNGNFTTTAYFPFFSSSSSAHLLTVKGLENNGVIPALYWDQNAFNPPVKWATPNSGLCESPCGEGPLYFISLISLLWFTPCKGIPIPEYGKIVLVKSRIRNAEKFWFWNPNSSALKSRIQLNESGIQLNPSSTDEDWNPVLGIWIPGVESRIQLTFLDSITWDKILFVDYFSVLSLLFPPHQVQYQFSLYRCNRYLDKLETVISLLSLN